MDAAPRTSQPAVSKPSLRSRAGCFTCRRRKKKCDEQKQVCSGCRRNGLDCVWPSPRSAQQTAFDLTARRKRSSAASAILSTRREPMVANVTAACEEALPGRVFGEGHGPSTTTLDTPATNSIPTPVRAVDVHVSTARRSSSPAQPSDSDGGGQAGSPGSDKASCSVSSASSSPSSRPETSAATNETLDSADLRLGTMDVYDLDMTDAVFGDACFLSGPQAVDVTTLPLETTETGVPTTEISMLIPMPMPLSLFPQHGPGAFELLSYYLSRTANSMGNGSTDSNPFLVTLVPLAFSDHLVLQLILAQSAAHRQVAGEEHMPNDQVAHRHYTDSLRLFRSAVGEHLSGKAANKFSLTIRSLILSLTEVARGDVSGNVSRHLAAAKSLLPQLMADPGFPLPTDMRNFLVEHYIHMAALSLVSADSENPRDSFLDATMEQMARDLVEGQHIGQLCGCWLELLLVIPQIYDLGQRMRVSEAVCTDDILIFACIQTQVMSFVSNERAPPETRLAGLVFKQAVLLYLWSALGMRRNDNNAGFHQSLVATAIDDAMALLGQISAIARVNTSLCWPLAVIGCCTSDELHQNVIRTRLQTMFASIGLGNMRETLVLLERVWAAPVAKPSPWALHDLMKEHQAWVSFA